MDDELKYLEKYHSRRLSLKTTKQRVADERHFAKDLGTGFSSRITVPSCHIDHFTNALDCFRELVDRLEQINVERQQPKTSDVSTIYNMKQAMYYCHSELKRRADYSLKFPKSPSTDFRNTR